MSSRNGEADPQASSQRRRLLDLLFEKHGAAAAPLIGRRAGPGHARLSSAQKRLWFLERMGGLGGAYHIADAVRVRGALRPDVLLASLREILRRHEALRTRFFAIEGKPYQKARKDWSFDLPTEDLAAFDPEAREDLLNEKLLRESERPFDLELDLPFRARLLRLDEGEHVLLIVAHHIVCDGWSLGVFWRELGILYEAFLRGAPSPLPELDIQYADYAEWQQARLRQGRLQGQLDYWRGRLAALPSLQLPTDRQRLPAQGSRGAWHRFELAPEPAGRVRRLSRDHGATLFMTLLAAFQALLQRYTGQDDFGIGIPVAGRSRPETEALIGFFANSLVIRADLGGEPAFGELLGRVRGRVLEALENQDLPFERLVKELRPERDLSRNPLFQAAFVMQEMPEVRLAGLQVERECFDPPCARFDLEFHLVEEGGGIRGEICYSTDLFEAGTIERMAGHYLKLIEGVTSSSGTPACRLKMLTEAEELQLEGWNRTATDYPRDKTIPDLFEEQAARTPEAVALVGGGQSLTYRELNERANRLAHFLLGQGMEPGAVVGICLERSPEAIECMLAVLKAGAAYLPLEVSHPAARLRLLLEDAGVRVVVTAGGLRDRLPEWEGRLVLLDGDGDAIGREPAVNPPRQTGAGSVAYVMYTSGSTGAPKGVCALHRGVVRLVKGADYADFSADDVFLHHSPAAFDASTFEIWGCLLNGARLVVLPAQNASLRELAEAIRKHEVTTLWLTAGLFHAMVDEAPDGLEGVKQLLAGGDVLSPRHVRKALEQCPGLVLINGYGPTENTTFTCCHRMERPEDLGEGSVPIGRPIANTRVYVLDRWGQPAPIGVPGELHAGGDGVAGGYLNRPDLTAETFIPDPFGGEEGARLYRTGDLVRRRADGTLNFLGRQDRQVKIRGFRVELGEVEAALSRHQSIEEAAVVARERREGKQLTAYVVLRSGASPAAAEIRDFLARLLPGHMIPPVLVFLPGMPRTPHGKVDRAALPDPDWADLQVSRVPPRSEVEQTLAGIWANLLGMEEVGVKDSFFDLGGHSLLAVRLLAAVEAKFGVNLPLAALFQNPTIEALAGIIGAEGVPAKWSCLVPLQPQGTRPPFFCMHPLCGDVVGFMTWTAHLGEDQPFYGMRARGLDGIQEPFETIEAMAADYLKAIRRIQPRGPYFLGGYGPGSMTALEAAQQLRAVGEEAALLAVINYPAFDSDYYRVRPDLRFLAAFARNLPAWLRDAFRLKYAGLLYHVHMAVRRSGLLGRLGRYRVLCGATERLGRRMDEHARRLINEHDLALLDGSGVPTSHVPRQARVAGAHSAALGKYSPRLYPGRIVVFRTRRQPLFCSFDPGLCWGRVAMGGVEVVEVPGSTASLVKEPHARAFALCLSRHLEAARYAR